MTATGGSRPTNRYALLVGLSGFTMCPSQPSRKQNDERLSLRQEMGNKRGRRLPATLVVIFGALVFMTAVLQNMQRHDLRGAGGIWLAAEHAQRLCLLPLLGHDLSARIGTQKFQHGPEQLRLVN